MNIRTYLMSVDSIVRDIPQMSKRNFWACSELLAEGIFKINLDDDQEEHLRAHMKTMESFQKVLMYTA
uniref:Uncharacterized protein n=1 Tax=Tanacetum cinerariifolium TaxID=118510 RepID=A0A6L2KRX7_TANCI|nr:hypothetical protein [Tanacetum cinerariifolium]